MIAQTVGRVGSIWRLAGRSNGPSERERSREPRRFEQSAKRRDGNTPHGLDDDDATPGGRNEHDGRMGQFDRMELGPSSAARSAAARRCPREPATSLLDADVIRVTPMLAAARCARSSVVAAPEIEMLERVPPPRAE
jgi:hypothetical protein